MLVKKHKNKKDRGLILLELVVALGIFLAVMTIGMGAVLAMYGLNKKSQSLKLVMTNLNFAVESMAREIVVGTDYRCDDSDTDPPDCPMGGPGGGAITFCSSENERIVYKFDSNAIKRSIQPMTADGQCPSQPSSSFLSITAPEVAIDTLSFFVEGTETVDCEKQPRVVILIEGVAGVREEEKSEFSIQTTVSQRVPKINASCHY